MVHVYGKPGCVQCKFTNQKLENENIPYEYHDIDADEQARKIVEMSEKRQLPLVVAGDLQWHGFSPDRIKSLLVSA
jgi:glutaredoxin-like protein NrdH